MNSVTRFFDGFIKYADKMSPLGNATAMDCANYTITLFSDLTKRVTLQNLYNDGGFSNMGVSDSIMDIIDKSKIKAYIKLRRGSSFSAKSLFLFLFLNFGLCY